MLRKEKACRPCSPPKWNYWKAGAYKVKSVVPINCVTLDDATKGYAVDIIKMNVQGASHEICVGAEAAIENVLAIQLDLFFDKIYEGQKSFQDTHDLLQAKGFRLYSMSCPKDNGIISQGIFTYYKNANLLNRDQLLKALAISLALENYEYAHSIMKECRRLFPENNTKISAISRVID